MALRRHSQRLQTLVVQLASLHGCIISVIAVPDGGIAVSGTVIFDTFASNQDGCTQAQPTVADTGRAASLHGGVI